MDEEYVDTAIELIKDKDPFMQASALYVFGEHPKDKGLRKYIFPKLKDSSPEVRAEAIRALKKHIPTKADKELCDAMLNDGDPIVRKAAVEVLDKVRRPSAVKCLRQLAMKEEPDAEVRESLIKTLGSALGDGKKPAYQALCDAIPFWLRTYITDDVVDNLKGVHIVKEHNRVDWENSPKCIERAYKQRSSFSCYAKMHISLWHNLTTGQDKKTPLCPDMEEYSEMK